ncbi:MAG: methylated-DNA-[protein]-cysteine S-methyltransferase [Streptomyces sp.]|nr:methylated-DNA-[protein]-cysteine S-methyltransferase [Streptomyces sp.]
MLDSPVGDVVVVGEGGALVGLYFAHRHRGRPAPEEFGTRDDTGFEAVRQQLKEYFAGQRREFDLPLAPRGNPFQRRVWELIAAIPYGRTRTYGELAADLADGQGGEAGDIGVPADRSAAQAVGGAVGANPLSVLIGCHRVMGAGGKLTGYAGGLERKRFLLDLEEPADQKEARLF